VLLNYGYSFHAACRYIGGKVLLNSDSTNNFIITRNTVELVFEWLYTV
jgi:hypothetical protein